MNSPQLDVDFNMCKRTSKVLKQVLYQKMHWSSNRSNQQCMPVRQRCSEGREVSWCTNDVLKSDVINKRSHDTTGT